MAKAEDSENSLLFAVVQLRASNEWRAHRKQLTRDPRAAAT
jgi:hypothetical protein